MSAREEWSRVIARAWTNPDFMARLKADPKATLEDPEVRRELQLEEIGVEGNYFPLGDVPEGMEETTEAEIIDLMQGNQDIRGINLGIHDIIC